MEEEGKSSTMRQLDVEGCQAKVGFAARRASTPSRVASGAAAAVTKVGAGPGRWHEGAGTRQPVEEKGGSPLAGRHFCSTCRAEEGGSAVNDSFLLTRKKLIMEMKQSNSPSVTLRKL